MEQKTPEFNTHLIQLIWGMQSTAWMALGKQMNPMTGKVEVNLDMARDSIDTLLMLREKTKGNLTEAEQAFLQNAMQDLELNFIDVKNKEENKQKEEQKEDKKKPEEKEEDKKE